VLVDASCYTRMLIVALSDVYHMRRACFVTDVVYRTYILLFHTLLIIYRMLVHQTAVLTRDIQYTCVLHIHFDCTCAQASVSSSCPRS
jgi:hypothetical protein